MSDFHTSEVSTNKPELNNKSQNTAIDEKSQNKKIQIGVNYLSSLHMYNNGSSDVFENDFKQFKADGLNVISLSLHWYRLEGHTQGDYSGKLANYLYGDLFLEGIKNIIKIAHQNGLQVLVTFHTLWGKDDSGWNTPDYVIDPVTGNNTGKAIVRSQKMRQAFIDMFSHTVKYLANTPGIWAWAILNEPWYWGRKPREHDFITSTGKTQKENFITLAKELSDIVKAEDGRPVTIRFCNTNKNVNAQGVPVIKNIFVEDWSWDQRLLDALDFMSFNVYMPKHEEIESSWKKMTITNINGCAIRNKPVWITEFGSKLEDHVAQLIAFKKMLRFYRSLPIDGCIAWQWSRGKKEDPVVKDKYNIWSSKTKKEKPAYQSLLDAVKAFNT